MLFLYVVECLDTDRFIVKPWSCSIMHPILMTLQHHIYTNNALSTYRPFYDIHTSIHTCIYTQTGNKAFEALKHTYAHSLGQGTDRGWSDDESAGVSRMQLRKDKGDNNDNKDNKGSYADNNSDMHRGPMAPGAGLSLVKPDSRSDPKLGQNRGPGKPFTGTKMTQKGDKMTGKMTGKGKGIDPELIRRLASEDPTADTTTPPVQTLTQARLEGARERQYVDNVHVCVSMCDDVIMCCCDLHMPYHQLTLILTLIPCLHVHKHHQHIHTHTHTTNIHIHTYTHTLTPHIHTHSHRYGEEERAFDRASAKVAQGLSITDVLTGRASINTPKNTSKKTQKTYESGSNHPNWGARSPTSGADRGDDVEEEEEKQGILEAVRAEMQVRVVSVYVCVCVYY